MRKRFRVGEPVVDNADRVSPALLFRFERTAITGRYPSGGCGKVAESTCIEVRNVKVRARQTERVTVLTRNAKSRASIVRLYMHRPGNSGELRTQVGMVA